MTTFLSTASALSPMQFAMLLGAILSGMASGMMYVFSTGAMAGLGRLPAAEAVRAMQAINVAVINPLFLSVFMGTGAFIAVLAGVDLVNTDALNPALLLAAVVYSIGVVGVTIVGNVPLNDRLASVDSSAMPAGVWQAYARPWLRWNHARSFAGALASALLILGVLG